MEIFKIIERKIQGFLELLTSKIIRNHIHPAEILKKMQVSVESNLIPDVLTDYAPDSFTVSIGSEDYQKYLPIKHLLEQELAQLIKEYIDKKKYVISGRIKVEIIESANMDKGICCVSGSVMGTTTMSGNDLSIQISREYLTRIQTDNLARLKVIEGEDKGKEYSIDKDTVVCGRSSEADIALQDNSARMSRRHFRIDHSNGSFTIKDLNSSNGTYVDGKKIDSTALYNGIQIGAGSVLFEFAVL